MRRKITNADKYVLRHLNFDEIVGPVSLRRERELLTIIKTVPLQPEAEKAKQELVQRNLRLVCKIAFRYLSYLGRGRDISDIMQAGTLGLIHAIHRFDLRKTNKFGTYATWWIRDYIQQELGIRKRRNQRIDRAYAELCVKEQRKISAEDLALATGLSKEALLKYKLYRQDPVSLDAPVEGNSFDGSFNTELRITYPDEGTETRVERELDWQKVREVVNRLSPKDALFVKRRFGIGNIQARHRPQLAEMYAITENQVRDWEYKVLKKLRSMLVDESLFGQRDW